MVRALRFRLALLAIVSLWLALRLVYWNGYYTEDAPGYVTDAIWIALGNYHARDHVNGLNVGTYFPVALPIRILGKSEIALALWPLACSLLGLLSIAAASRILFGVRASLLAALLHATYPGDVFFSTVVMPDALQSGWVSFSYFLIALAYSTPHSPFTIHDSPFPIHHSRFNIPHSPFPVRPRSLLAGAGVAIGVCHLIRSNDVLILPAGMLAVLACARIRAGRRWSEVAIDAATYAGGWAIVGVAEGIAYLVATGDFLHRLHVVGRHYGTLESIARAGLNTDPRTIPFSLFAPVTWWLHGGWGGLNQDQAYHGLLFVWAVPALALGAVSLAVLGRRVDRRHLAGFVLAAVWLLWPLLYHQLGSQSVTQFVPIHRLSRHLVVYAPGAIMAIVAGCVLAGEAVRALESAAARRTSIALGGVLLVVHCGFNWRAERVAYDAFHRIKGTYARIRAHLPEGTRTIVADPGDLCFFDFWMNPLGSERVSLVPFAAVATCGQIREGVVFTQSNPGWHGGAPIIQETVRRLPCLVSPPASWRLVYEGYPERIFEVAASQANASQ